MTPESIDHTRYGDLFDTIMTMTTPVFPTEFYLDNTVEDALELVNFNADMRSTNGPAKVTGTGSQVGVRVSDKEHFEYVVGYLIGRGLPGFQWESTEAEYNAEGGNDYETAVYSWQPGEERLYISLSYYQAS